MRTVILLATGLLLVAVSRAAPLTQEETAASSRGTVLSMKLKQKFTFTLTE